MTEGFRRDALGLLAAVLVALAGAAAITWPMVTMVDQIVLGGGELGGWLWRYDWHFREVRALAAADLGALDAWREFVSLGRYPETGNILDVLVFNLPLETWQGFPASYNLKILLVLVGNGIAGYALARYASGSVSAAIAASVVAVVNPITLLEIQASGLRQALLWWVLLYPAVLDRALRRRTLYSGMLAGAVLGLTGAFYWFYGLFSAMFSVLWYVLHLVVERRRLALRGMFRTSVGLGVGLLLVAGPFILPYACAEGGAQVGTREALPELTFFLPYPPFDTVIHAPLRPQSYAENILASIHRTIGSSWSASYLFDPAVDESLPLAVLVLGVLPAFVRRRSWMWLAVWVFFYVGTLGPFLRWGDTDARDVVRVGDYVVRLPYTLMFQFVPGMSRMFAPYRLGSYVVVASVALLAIGIARLSWRAWIAPIVVVATIAQPLYRWGRGAVNEGAADSRQWRSPIKANRIQVPEYYRTLAKEPGLTGIVELPLEQQQDLLCYYQVIHGKKVYRAWASPGAIPPGLRAPGAGGAIGEQLRFQAREDERGGEIYRLWEGLSRSPEDADVRALNPERFRAWATNGNYTRIIVHERGYYLVDPRRGGALYSAAVNKVAEALGMTGTPLVEVQRGDRTNPIFGVPTSGDLLPWTSQPIHLPSASTPAKYMMTVFEVPPATASTPATPGAGAEAAPATPPPAADASSPRSPPEAPGGANRGDAPATPPPATGAADAAPQPLTGSTAR